MKIFVSLIFPLFVAFSYAKICHINRSQNSIENKYPESNKFIYAINFNDTLMQANYVYYINPKDGNSCSNCQYFRIDPYGINILKHEDYTNTSFSRGHLVPNADYGYDTYIISNVVPMTYEFNQEIWNEVERYLRDKYKELLIYKGCEYSFDNYINSNLNNTLYIPLGCYYVVFDINILPEIYEDIKGNVLDYGYYKHSKLQKNNTLPWWIICEL